MPKLLLETLSHFLWGWFRPLVEIWRHKSSSVKRIAVRIFKWLLGRFEHTDLKMCLHGNFVVNHYRLLSFDVLFSQVVSILTTRRERRRAKTRRLSVVPVCLFKLLFIDLSLRFQSNRGLQLLFIKLKRIFSLVLAFNFAVCSLKVVCQQLVFQFFCITCRC